MSPFGPFCPCVNVTTRVSAGGKKPESIKIDSPACFSWYSFLEISIAFLAPPYNHSYDTERRFYYSDDRNHPKLNYAHYHR